MIIREEMDQGRFCRERSHFFPCVALLAYDPLERNETCTVAQLEEDNDPVAVKRRSPAPLTNETKHVLFSTEWVHHSGSGGEDKWPIDFCNFSSRPPFFRQRINPHGLFFGVVARSLLNLDTVAGNLSL